MTSIPIESNVPIHTPNYPHKKYPFRDMNIGDSIFVKTEQTSTVGPAPAVSYFKRRNPNFNFTIRKVEGGWRIWRIAT